MRCAAWALQKDTLPWRQGGMGEGWLIFWLFFFFLYSVRTCVDVLQVCRFESSEDSETSRKFLSESFFFSYSFLLSTSPFTLSLPSLSSPSYFSSVSLFLSLARLSFSPLSPQGQLLSRLKSNSPEDDRAEPSQRNADFPLVELAQSSPLPNYH